MTPLNRLLIFTRYPEAGLSKTRLIPALGAAGAALLQRRLTERVVVQAKELATRYPVQVEIHYYGGSVEQLTAWLGSFPYRPQVPGDLGRKMQAAFTQAFHQGVAAAVLVGSDIPCINNELLEQAFAVLNEVPVVLGPSRDGGYYLVGLTSLVAARVLPLLFEDMVWSSETVLGVTLRRLQDKDIPVDLLPQLKDIDRPEDLSLVRELGLL